MLCWNFIGWCFFSFKFIDFIIRFCPWGLTQKYRWVLEGVTYWQLPPLSKNKNDHVIAWFIHCVDIYMYIRFIWKWNKGKSYLNKNAFYLVNIKYPQAPDIIVFFLVLKKYIYPLPISKLCYYTGGGYGFFIMRKFNNIRCLLRYIITL